MRTNEERLGSAFLIWRTFRIKARDPNINCIWIRVTSFMDSHLKNTLRRPGDNPGQKL